MTESELITKQEQLAADRVKLERERLEFEQKKMQRLTILLSTVAVLVSSLQVGVAFLQSRLTMAQTVEKFIPHLQKPETRDAALLTMSAFIGQDFVTQLAEKLKATNVLEVFTSKGSDREKNSAMEALSSLDATRKSLIEKIFSNEKKIRISATTELVRQWQNDPKIVPQLIEVSALHPGNPSGIINALVILGETPPEALRANAAELLPFLDKAKLNGPQTASLARLVLDRSAIHADLAPPPPPPPPSPE